MRAALIVIVVLAVVGGAYFLISTGKVSNPLSKNTTTPTDIGAKIYQQNKNPVSGLPETNPFSKVNPFKGVYKNPFQ